jgi:hypothetical protein
LNCIKTESREGAQLLALVEEIGNTVNVFDVIVDHESLIIEPK